MEKLWADDKVPLFYYSERVKRRCIYLALFVDPEGGCFSIYQMSWIKMKKSNFCKLKMSLSSKFVYNLHRFRFF